MARRPVLRDVELHDAEVVDAPDEGTGTPPPPEPTAPAVADGRRRRWPLVLGAAVLAVLVAVGVTGQVVVDRRERARLAAVAAHPGAVPLLDGPPAALWTVPESELYEVAQMRTTDGLLLGVRRDDDGSVAATATDPATGDAVWSVELLATSAAPEPVAGAFVVDDVLGWCRPYGAAEHRTVCLASDGVALDGTGATRVVVVDTRERTVVTDLTPALPADERIVAAAVVGDLAVVTTEATDGTSVHALAADGTRRWERTVPTIDPDRGVAHAEPLGDLVAIETDTQVVLLDQDGRTVRTLDLDGRLVFGGTTELHLVTRPDVEALQYATTIVRPDGDLEVEGEVVFSRMDDGSVPGLVLTSDRGALRGWVGGEQRWSIPADGVWDAVLLDGRVYVQDGGELHALDARTGRELWTSDALTALPVTDGRHLLGVARVADRGEQAQVVALDPVDGSETWRAPAPEGSHELHVHLGLLLVGDGGFDGVEGGSLAVLG